ncbi:MAG: hypothetical protein AAFU70_00395, partial [Planctomycetota bacterium]
MHRFSTRHLAPALLAIGASGSIVLQAVATQPPTNPGGPPEPRPRTLGDEAELIDMVEDARAEFDDADGLLDALEEAGLELETFEAELTYVKINALAGDRQTREGRLYLVNDESVFADDAELDFQRGFSIVFTALDVGDRRDELNERYIFDGRWLIEINENAKQFNATEVMPEGERIDPLRIGEGPFPVPIGQKKADILERFEAELLETEDGLSAFGPGPRTLAERFGFAQLRLVPRPGAAEEADFEEIRIWYDTRPGKALLPIMVRVVDPEFDESLIVLGRRKLNEP